MNIGKIKNQLKKNGYFVIHDYYSKKKCDYISKVLDVTEKKKLKNKNKDKEFSNTYDLLGQSIIREAICLDDEIFNLINNNNIYLLLKSIFNDQFIINESTGSRPIKTKQKYIPAPHVDSYIPAINFNNTTDVVIQVCVDDFSKKNGATKVWEKSHLSGKLCHKEKVNFKRYKKITLEAKKGSLIIFLGQTWHQLGLNITGERRWGILFHFTRWWLKPAKNYLYYFKKKFHKLSKIQKMMSGYSSIVPLPFTKRSKTKINLDSIEKDFNKAIKI